MNLWQNLEGPSLQDAPPKMLGTFWGANIGSTGDGTPLRGAKNLRTIAFPTWYLKIQTPTPCAVLVRANCVKTKEKYDISSELRDQYSPLEHLQPEKLENKSKSDIFTRAYDPSWSYIMLQKPSINRPSWERITIKFLQAIGVVAMVFWDLIRALVFMLGISLQY